MFCENILICSPIKVTVGGGMFSKSLALVGNLVNQQKIGHRKSLVRPSSWPLPGMVRTCR